MSTLARVVLAGAAILPRATRSTGVASGTQNHRETPWSGAPLPARACADTPLSAVAWSRLVVLGAMLAPLWGQACMPSPVGIAGGLLPECVSRLVRHL